MNLLNDLALKSDYFFAESLFAGNLVLYARGQKEAIYYREVLVCD